MAAGQKSRPESWALACELLLIVAAREYLWLVVPADLQGMASKGLGAALVLVALSIIHRLSLQVYGPSKLLGCVLLVAAWYSLQTMICSAAYMIEPWEVLPGQGICSARLDFDLGALGLIIVAWLAVRMSTVKVSSINNVD